VDFVLTAEEHDRTICAELGVAAGQVPGGWSIEHRTEPRTDRVLLTFPPDVLTRAEFEAVLSAHEPAAEPTPEPTLEDRIAALEAERAG
jgi:hypothetical protein